MMRLRGHVSVNPDVVRRVRERLDQIQKRIPVHRISIGIHGGEGMKLNYRGEETNTPLMQVALAHEFGLKVPERSYIRGWFDSNRSRLPRELAHAERMAFRGNPEAVTQLALRWQAELKEWVRSRAAGFPPLRPATVAARERAGINSETPLVATTQLIEAIRVKVDGQYV